MNLHDYMAQLRTEKGEICISEIQFIGTTAISEKQYIVHEFNDEWLQIVHGPGEQSFHFIRVDAIAACNVTNYKRRKTKR